MLKMGNKYSYCTGVFSSELGSVFCYTILCAIHCTELLPVIHCQCLKTWRQLERWSSGPRGCAKSCIPTCWDRESIIYRLTYLTSGFVFSHPSMTGAKSNSVQQQTKICMPGTFWGRLHHKSKGGDFRGSRCLRLWFPHLLVMKFVTSEVSWIGNPSRHHKGVVRKNSWKGHVWVFIAFVECAFAHKFEFINLWDTLRTQRKFWEGQCHVFSPGRISC